MRSSIIDRNYAETLLALAKRHGGDDTVDDFGAALDDFAQLLDAEPRVREFFESPLVNAESKNDALRKTLKGRAPEMFVRFLHVVVDKRRAPHIRGIAMQYRDMVDELRGRVRAEVIVAREPDEMLRTEIQASLQRMLGSEVLATYQVDESLLGGVVVRVGDQILDGSVRRRASELRRRLLAAELSPADGR